jgi:hypothetical protein
MTLLSDLKRLVLPPTDPREDEDDDSGLRRDERQAAVLTGKYPAEGEDVERHSEYRLASLLQYPHY